MRQVFVKCLLSVLMSVLRLIIVVILYKTRIGTGFKNNKPHFT